MVARQLAAVLGEDDDAIEIVVIKTSGDRIVDRPLAEVGGKGLFTKELEDALVDRRIDLAVHSMKDVATLLPVGLELAAVTEREDASDRLIGPAASLEMLPPGARLGTSSLRRAAQALAVRPDLVIVPFRGNVATRLDKLARAEADATILAAAGLNRLGRSSIGTPLSHDEMLPAAAQGIVGIEIRSGEDRLAEQLATLNHAPSWLAMTAERAFLERLDGSCRTPIAGIAKIDGSTLRMTGELLLPDGSQRSRQVMSGPASDPRALGLALAEEVLRNACWLA